MKLDRYEQSTATRRLSGQLVQRSSQTGFPTWGLVLFGLPFAGIGIVVVLIGTKIMPVNPTSAHAPSWVLSACGTVFGLGGLMLWSMAWKQFQSNRRRATARARHTNEPALEDYNWNPRGFEPPRWSRAAKSVAAVGAVALFLSIFNWWAFFNQGPLMVKIIASLFDLVFVFVCGQAVMLLGRTMKFGGSRIEFVRFPYRLGEPVVVRWLTPAGINRVAKGAFSLRCIGEWYEERGTGRNRNKTLVHEERWCGTWSLDQAQEFPPGKTVELNFDPPADADVPATCLSAVPAFFWEFEANLGLPGLDFKETYLVPVYAAA